MGEEAEAAVAQFRFDGHDDLAEQVAPRVVRAHDEADAGDFSGQCVAVVEAGGEIDAGVARESLFTGDHFRFGHRIAVAVAPAECAIAAGSLRAAGQGQRVGDHRGPFRMSAIPFDHGEFGAVQRAPFAIAPDAGEIDDHRFTGCQQFLGGEFGAGVEIECLLAPAFGAPLHGEAVQMCLVARADLHRAAFHRDETLISKPAGQRGFHAAPPDQERAAIGVDVGVPERAGQDDFP